MEISGHNLAEVPKWALVKLRDEMKARRDAEIQLEATTKELFEFRKEVAEWKENISTKYEDEIRKLKDQKVAPNPGAIDELKTKLEKEFQMKLSMEEDKLEMQKKKIQDAFQELENWKLNFQQFISIKEKELAKKDEELQDFVQVREVIKNYVTQPKGDTPIVKKRSDTTDSSSDSLYHAMRLQERADDLSAQIADLEKKKKKIENFVNEAELAKKALPLLDKDVIQRRKDLMDCIKDIKSSQIKKGKLEEIENHISIVSDPERRTLLLRSIQKLVLVPPMPEDPEIFDIFGPTEVDKLHQKEPHFAARATSLYPVVKGFKLGEPVADRFRACSFGTCAILALADGCGWGTLSKEAAEKAVSQFVAYMKSNRCELTNTIQTAKVMLRAYYVAHNTISQGTKDEYFTKGTTTMIGGYICKLDPCNQEKLSGVWMFTFVSLGDCKAWLLSPKKNSITDITNGNRTNVHSVNDPGGRIGPQLPNGAPDLGNLRLYSAACDDGDYILLMSDGVHDNLDPQMYGLSPQQLNLSSKENTWETVDNIDSAFKAKGDWMSNFMAKILMNQTPDPTSLDPTADPQINWETITVSHLVDSLVDHSVKVTQPSRDYMLTNPDKQVPPNPKLYPGKMDHSSCVAFRVGSSPLQLKL